MLAIFYIIVLCTEIDTTFGSKMVKQFPNEIQNIENLQTSQGYIFRILQPNFGILILSKGSFR